LQDEKQNRSLAASQFKRRTKNWGQERRCGERGRNKQNKQVGMNQRNGPIKAKQKPKIENESANPPRNGKKRGMKKGKEKKSGGKSASNLRRVANGKGASAEGMRPCTSILPAPIPGVENSKKKPQGLAGESPLRHKPEGFRA